MSADQPAISGATPAAASVYPALQMIDADIGSLRDATAVVLTDVNWRVAVGDYWAVGGLHASGKTDLMATAAGLMPPLKGTHLVFGQKVEAGFEPELLEARLRVAMVFDGGRLLNDLTIAENVILPLRYHDRLPAAQALDRAELLLDYVGLTRQAQTLPGGLSRNWRQRVGLARALSLQPDVLLVDDIVTGMDPRETWWWLGILDELASGSEVMNKQAMTIVATTGDLRPFNGRARQFAVLHEKRFRPFFEPLESALETDPHLRELLGLNRV